MVSSLSCHVKNPYVKVAYQMDLVFYAKIFRGGIFLPISTLPLERNPLPPVSLPLVKLFDVEMC